MTRSMNAAPTSSHRPAWLLAMVAWPLGVLIQGITGGLDNLPQALLTLMGWLDEPTRLQRLAAALVSNMLLPTLAVFVLLRWTRLGHWLAPNRLALIGLALANGLMLFIVLHGVYQAANNMPPYLMGTLKHVIHPATTAAVIGGLGALFVSTLWHRVLRHNAQVLAFGQRLWREC